MPTDTVRVTPVVRMPKRKQNHVSHAYNLFIPLLYRGADKSLARPGRRQPRKHFRNVRDFNNIEKRAAIKLFFLQGKAPKEIQAILTETLTCFVPGRVTDFAQHPCNSKITVASHIGQFA